MSIQEQRRAAFEAWFVMQAFSDLHLERFAAADFLYEQDEVEAMWTGWNAALDSVVIELPAEPALEISAEESLDMEPEDFEAMEVSHGLQCMMLRKCRTAIEVAGLKVSP